MNDQLKDLDDQMFDTLKDDQDLLLDGIEDQDLHVDEDEEIDQEDENVQIEDVESPSSDRIDNNRQVLNDKKLAASHAGAGKQFADLDFS